MVGSSHSILSMYFGSWIISHCLWASTSNPSPDFGSSSSSIILRASISRFDSVWTSQMQHIENAWLSSFGLYSCSVVIAKMSTPPFCAWFCFALNTLSSQPLWCACCVNDVRLHSLVIANTSAPHFTLTFVLVAFFHATHRPNHQFAVYVSMSFIHALSLTPKRQPSQIVLDVISPASFRSHGHLAVPLVSTSFVHALLSSPTRQPSHITLTVVPTSSFHVSHCSQDKFAVPVVFMPGSLAVRVSSTTEEGIAKYKTETDKLDGWWTGGAEGRKIEDLDLGFWKAK